MDLEYQPQKPEINNKVHTGQFVLNLRSFQGLLKDFPTVFKD